MSSNTKFFVALVTVAAVLTAAVLYSIAPGMDAESARTSAFFALIALVAYALSHQVAHGATGSIAHLPFLAAVLVAPGFTSILAITGAALAGEVLLRRAWLKTLFNVAQISLACSLAAVALLASGGGSLALGLSATVGPSIVAFFAFAIANTVLVSGVIAISQRRRFVTVWRHNSLHTVLYDVLSLPTAYLFGWVYLQTGPYWSLGLTLPLFGLRQLYKVNWQLEKINEELLQLMVAAIEARDPYTSGHSQRVAEYTRIVAEAAGLGSRASARVYTAALLHDVGKIHEEFAPILRKPGRLTDDEYAVMKSHPEKGAVLVGKVSQFHDLVPAVRNHHEAWDGHGYPDGLIGDQIPLWARIIAFADTIDAMTSDRPYRKALDAEAVRREIQAVAGRQFDPEISLRLISDQHWPRMSDTIRSKSASRRPTPLFIEAVPRHSSSRRSVSM